MFLPCEESERIEMIHPKLDVARLLREPEWWTIAEPEA
jgi:hypothetical protein